MTGSFRAMGTTGTEGSDGAEGRPSRWGALAYPSYRRFWFSSLVLVFGMQFHFFASGWLVVAVLGRSPIWLGVVGLSQALPTILLSVPAGALADRFEHRRLLVIGRTLSMLNYAVLATLVVTGLVNIWLVIVWAVIAGSLAAISGPAQQAILPRLIEMKAMASAVAFNSAIWNSMRIIAPAGAGVLIAAIGVGEAFYVTAAGFAVSTLLIVTLRLKPLPPRTEHADRSLLAGLRYIFAHRLFLAVVGLSFFSSLFGMSYQWLMPIFAHEILDVGATGYGTMSAVGGIGALLGTLSVVRLGATRYRGQFMIAAAALAGLFVAAFAWSTFFPLSLALLFVAGFLSSVYLNVGMTTLQILVPDEVRGRVMGVWSMTWSLTPVGAFVVGAGAELIGTPAMVAFGGLSVTAFALGLYLLSADVRSIPEVETRGLPAGARAG